MEEIEKAKMSRIKISNNKEIHQTMTALVASTVQGIVMASNKEGIQREDIVSLLKENGQYILIYFR